MPSKYNRIKKFEPGRIVLHKSTGRLVTITRYMKRIENDYIVSVSWLEENKITTGKFPESELEAIAR